MTIYVLCCLTQSIMWTRILPLVLRDWQTFHLWNTKDWVLWQAIVLSLQQVIIFCIHCQKRLILFCSMSSCPLVLASYRDPGYICMMIFDNNNELMQAVTFTLISLIFFLPFISCIWNIKWAGSSLQELKGSVAVSIFSVVLAQGVVGSQQCQFQSKCICN